jgi:hypothetical protein
MSVQYLVPEDLLVPIECPHDEPRISFQTHEPRKVNNLTLIDGKTFLSTTVAGDIHPAGAPDVGFFHDDTRFLSHLELRINGYRSVVLSSSTEKTFASQIELTTGHMNLRDSYEVPENTVHIRREQLLSGDIFFDRITSISRPLSSTLKCVSTLTLSMSSRCAGWHGASTANTTSRCFAMAKWFSSIADWMTSSARPSCRWSLRQLE